MIELNCVFIYLKWQSQIFRPQPNGVACVTPGSWQSKKSVCRFTPSSSHISPLRWNDRYLVMENASLPVRRLWFCFVVAGKSPPTLRFVTFIILQILQVLSSVGHMLSHRCVTSFSDTDFTDVYLRERLRDCRFVLVLVLRSARRRVVLPLVSPSAQSWIMRWGISADRYQEHIEAVGEPSEKSLISPPPSSSHTHTHTHTHTRMNTCTQARTHGHPHTHTHTHTGRPPQNKPCSSSVKLKCTWSPCFSSNTMRFKNMASGLRVRGVSLCMSVISSDIVYYELRHTTWRYTKCPRSLTLSRTRTSTAGQAELPHTSTHTPRRRCPLTSRWTPARHFDVLLC